MLVTYNSPRHIHELLAEVDLLYNLGSDRPNVTFRGGWKAFLLTGPRSEASVNADASMGQLNALQASQPSDQGSLQVMPLGRVETRQFSGGSNFAWQASKFSRILRYEFSYQKGDTVGEMVVPTFFRNTFYFTFALRFPEEVQVRVPRRNQSVRADKGDLSPIGAEPVVVDPAELLQQE